MITNDDITQCI
jgi:hypothetical protein